MGNVPNSAASPSGDERGWGEWRGERRSDVVEEIVWSPRLGAHLEASRVHAGRRRLDLAAQLGVSEETIRLWEKGAVQPSAERLARLIALLALETSEWPARVGLTPAGCVFMFMCTVRVSPSCPY